ncbi:hypothetical protein SDC9_84242 [bioreactor metagenome]|uniref:Non-reducing end beta-L-arabinofuranosidase-like GH127 C-terminal domain-containing protein n=1 Tax=bioreactor metagenome TaxID=1076179 RepID=A0A644ZII4_9ZZZZ
MRVRIPPYFKKPVFRLEGKEISPVVENGYAVLAISRAGEQTFTLCGDVKPEFFAANEQVRADLGKVALVMGPYVYCLEETDNGNNLACVYAKPSAEIEKKNPLSELPGELPVLEFSGERVVRSTKQPGALYSASQFEKADVRLTAVPYCLWCNRQPGEMLVWMKANI